MTLRYQILAFLILAIFYSVYFGKMMVQKKQGIVTDQIGMDTSDIRRFRIEKVMKAATVFVVAIEAVSIIWGHSFYNRYSFKTTGVMIGFAGDIFFLAAVLTMGNSWRAGVAADQHREFVSKGIFKISRNPAFLGFDLVYIGILLMFFNWLLLVFSIFPIIMLHLQILQEEKYLKAEYGEGYLNYKKTVCRYFGRKNAVFCGIAAIILIAVGLFGTYFMNLRIKAIHSMTCEECIRNTTMGNSDSVITVGVYKDGEMSYRVYGENGKELEDRLHTYEICSSWTSIT